MTEPNFPRPWWTRGEFLKTGAATVAGALSPDFGLAGPVPDQFDGSAFKLAARNPTPNRAAC